MCNYCSNREKLTYIHGAKDRLHLHIQQLNQNLKVTILKTFNHK